jgi:hypothetical protein
MAGFAAEVELRTERHDVLGVGGFLTGGFVGIDGDTGNLAALIVRAEDVALEAAVGFGDGGGELSHEVFNALFFASTRTDDRETDVGHGPPLSWNLGIISVPTIVG